MTLKLYGYGYSTCTQRVALILHELNVPFEYIEIDLAKGEHTTEAYKNFQPFGLVPYIDEDGFILYESRAICNYIVTKYASQGGATLVPKDLKANAIFQQGCAIEVAHFDAAATPLIHEKMFIPMQGLTPNEDEIKMNEKKLLTALDGYERVLSKQKYIGGNELTLADLYHLPILALLPLVDFHAINEKPAMSRWVKEISSRPAWQTLKDGIKSTA